MTQEEQQHASPSSAPSSVVVQRRKQQKDIFGVQLDVTSRLLDAEKLKLAILQREIKQKRHLEGTKKEKELERQKNNLERFQIQHDRLEWEYEQAACDMFKGYYTLKPHRSLPHLGLKQTPKTRPSIFGTLAKDKSPARDENKRRSMPQTPSFANIFKAVEGESTTPTLCNGHTTSETSSTQESEEVEKDKALEYEDGNLISGTLEAFIRHIVPTGEYYPDRTYLFAFLLSSRLYIKPYKLLEQVCQLCITQQNLNSTSIDKSSLSNFCSNLMQLLSEWTETFPYDFRDERLMKQLRDITQKCIAINPMLRKTVGQLMQMLIKKLSTLEKYEDVLARVTTAAAERMQSLRTNPEAFQTNIIDICPDPYILAQQLTHIELERLTNIGPEEFVQAFIKEGIDESKVKFRDLKRTKNLEAYVEWFNRLSYLVATEICMHIKKKHRAKLIEYFIEVARECFNIGNFNSLMAIMSGINMSPVMRLRKTWAKVNTQKYDVLEHQMDPSNNWSTYRQSLRAAMQRALSAREGACDRIVIPFFSLLVKDIYFLNEGCSNRLSNGHINFEKFWQLAKQVTVFMTWKNVECPYERDRKALNYLLTAPVFSENSLYLASYESEGPDNAFERDKYKTLKNKAAPSHK
ncbi:ras-GEF domain-containing family member 1B-like isoform X2 [Antedon mediterranea]|uniref:ras-GEF domain-containing family member 1B-like isoform X2 n=1 Tax=Antedon mediterranea TaxID=105859 RepID=UPI003AF76EB6